MFKEKHAQKSNRDNNEQSRCSRLVAWLSELVRGRKTDRQGSSVLVVHEAFCELVNVYG